MLYLLLSLQEEFEIFSKKNNWEDIFVMLHSPVRKVLGPNLTRDKRHSVIARDRGRANSCEQQIHIF